MAQRNDLIEKIRATWDGEEIPGLVSCSEIVYEQGVVEVPELRRKRRMADGTIGFPPVTLVYSVQKNSRALAFFQSFFLNHECHTLIRVRVDATNSEFGRIMARDCECSKMTDPEVDLERPGYAKITVEVLPWEVTPLPAEG